MYLKVLIWVIEEIVEIKFLLDSSLLLGTFGGN